jgi:pimeloyl-ACP methyl ester carboxylesterase
MEAPVIFSSNGFDLFGVLTLPKTEPLTERIGVILVAGGIFPRSHRNRMWVKAARRLGELGFHVLRFDCRGIGDSSGSLFEMRLDCPFTEDVLAAAAFLRSVAKVDRLILAGTCFGALTVLSAVEAAAPVDGLVLGAIPIFERKVRRFNPHGERWPRKPLRKMGELKLVRAILAGEKLDAVWRLVTRLAGAGATALEGVVNAFSRLVRPVKRAQSAAGPSGRVSDHFATPLVAALQRRVPILFIYGDEDFYQEFCASIDDLVLRAGLPLSEPGYELNLLKGEVHRFLSVGIQEAVVERLVGWVASRFSVTSGASRIR